MDPPDGVLTLDSEQLAHPIVKSERRQADIAAQHVDAVVKSVMNWNSVILVPLTEIELN
jgi:hypothetical protein